MSRLGLMLQEPDAGTILRLLRPQCEDYVQLVAYQRRELHTQMEDVHGERSRRRSFKERMGIKGMGGCCGATWGFGFAAGDVIDVYETAEISRRRVEQEEVTAVCPRPNTTPGQASTGMNHAAALAVERCYRPTERGTGGGSGSASSGVEQTETAGGTVEEGECLLTP